MRSPNRPARGFTLIEVVLAIGLSAVLLAALYEAIHLNALAHQVADQEVRQAQVARTVLHRIAAELRGLEPMSPSVESSTSAPFAVGLLEIGANLDSVGQRTNPLADRFGTEPPRVPEPFRLLGTSNRLLMMTRVQRSAPFGAADDSTTARDGRQVEWRDYPFRQVLYYLKPARGKERDESELIQKEESVDGRAVVYRGLVRQETFPFSLDALYQARAELEAELAIDKQIDAPDVDEPLVEESEFVARELVLTGMLAEEVTAVRFRYHDGARWMEHWARTDQLPIAVEISLSFDPKAGDPAALAEQFLLDADAEAMPALAVDETERVEPIFPYRLVVALATGSAAPREPALAPPAEAAP